MSREIKFRGKSIENNELVYGYLFKIWERTYILWGTTNDVPNMIEVIPETVGQYTGLKDKNGVEIYEGDILNTYGYQGIVIEFENGSFMCKASDKVQYANNTIDIPISRFDVLRLYEVIGNIHESEVSHDQRR